MANHSHVMHKPSLPSPASVSDLLDGIPTGVLVLDPTRRILYANRWWTEHVGLAVEQQTDSTLDELLLESECARAKRALDHLFATGEATSWQAHLTGLAGEMVVAFSARPVCIDTGVRGAQVNCLDVTPYRHALDEADTHQRDLERLRLRIASYLDLKELLTNSAALLRERFGCDHVRIYLKDQDRDRLTLEAQSPPDPEWPVPSVILDPQSREPLVWVALHGRSRLAGEGPPRAATEGVASRLCVPICFADHVLGVLDMDQSGHSFDERDRFTLESLSSQIAAGIENAQLYEMVNKQLAEVSTLYMLADQLSSSLDTNTILDRVTNILKRVLNCRGCVLFLLDEDREWLEIQVSSGIKPQWRQARLRLGEGIAGRVAQTGQPIYIPDTQQDPDYIVFDPAVRSLLVVPLMYKGQVIGTLNVDDDKPDAFPPDTVRILSIAGAQAAVAIENARLFEALKERAERLAQAHRELQESDRLRTEFVQNISHELRTPLTFIRGYVELLLDGVLGRLTQQQAESLLIVAERTARVTQLVDDILALQQVERGDLHLVPVSLEQIAHAEVRSAKAMAVQEGLSLIEEYAPDLRPALGDPERLGQVFANLIGNAIKFTPGPGTITVRLANAEGAIRADVIDEGIGIAEDHLERVFERFYQVDGSSKRRFRGTGLGLAIVKEIIDAHGGTITVSSEVGTGSTFSFALPVAPEPPADPT